MLKTRQSLRLNPLPQQNYATTKALSQAVAPKPVLALETSERDRLYDETLGQDEDGSGR